MGHRRTGALVVGIGLVIATGAAITLLDFDRSPERVPPVLVGTASGAGGPPGAAPAGSGTLQVPALDRVEGTLTRVGPGADDFVIGTVELDLGPEEWVTTSGPSVDFDGDGTTGSLGSELDGLLGRPVTVLGLLDGDGDEVDVYELNGVVYRDSAGGPAPWQLPVAPTGAVSSQADVAAAALAAVGPGARVDEIGRVDAAGAAVWEVEVIDATGREQRVLLDVSAVVLDVRPDD